MRVAVTGAGGYLGRALVGRLAGDERVEHVVAIDLRPPREAAKVRPARRDIRDPDIASELDGVDAVVHLAAVVLGRGSGADEVNIEGSRNVFAAARRKGAGTIVHASSAAAYGSTPENELPLTEDSPLRPEPDFYYPRTKVAVERMIDEIEREDADTRFVRFRPVATLGPGAPLAFGGRAFVTLSDFDPLIQFTWIDDVADAFAAALHAPARGAFNIGAPGPLRTSEVAGLLGVRGVRIPYRVARAAARTGSTLRLPGALHPAWVDMGRYPIVVDTARAERELGWRASCDCAGAVRRFAESLRERRSARSDVPIPREAPR